MKIIDKSYNAGRADFDAGMTLRGLVEKIAPVFGNPNSTEDDNDYYGSYALGFADAALDRLRKP